MSISSERTDQSLVCDMPIACPPKKIKLERYPSLNDRGNHNNNNKFLIINLLSVCYSSKNSFAIC